MDNKTILATVDGWTPVIDSIVHELGFTTAGVFGRIWRYCQMRDGVCTASQENIGEHLELDRAAINSHIDKLVKAGYIEKRQRPGQSCVLVDTGKAGMRVTISAGPNQGCTKKIHGNENNQPKERESCEDLIHVDELNSSTKRESKIQDKKEEKRESFPPKKQAGRAAKNPAQPSLIQDDQVVQKPQSNHNLMVSILARLCMMDVRLSASRIGATSSKLLKAGYVPDDLETFERWWKEKDFRGVKGEHPTLAIIEAKIYQAKQETPAPAAPKKKTQWIEHRDENGELLLEEVEVNE